jgi:methoxymalonate biosynthesis acyl carrier protein
MNEWEKEIREFFSLFFSTSHLRDDDDIFASGFVNSLFAMQLIAWIEKQFSIDITDEDLDIANFKSVNAIVGFVSQKSRLRAVARESK